jgi:hypothetical protein
VFVVCGLLFGDSHDQGANLKKRLVFGVWSIAGLWQIPFILKLSFTFFETKSPTF